MLRLYTFFVMILVAGMQIVFAGSLIETMVQQKVDPRLVRLVQEYENANKVYVSQSAFLKHVVSSRGYRVIVHAASVEEAINAGITPRAILSNLFTATVSAEQLTLLSRLPSVSYIEAPVLRYPKLDLSIPETKVDKLHAGLVNSTVYKGKNVIVGIIDSGIDWKHEDFRQDADPTKSRILFLYDLTLNETQGVEYTQADINDELDGTPTSKVLEKDNSGHGTHVAGTAAGDGSASGGKYKGVAPEADLIIVKAGEGSFSSDHIIEAINYINNKASVLGKPVVINMSLGGHNGGHDGTSSDEKTVDNILNNATGKQIVIAAGNEGSDAIHVDGTVSQGGSKVMTFTIPAYTAQAGANNDFVLLSMWYNAADQYTVKVKSPSGSILTANAGAFQNTSTADGYFEIGNGDAAANSKNRKESYVYVSDLDATKLPKAGTWEITVTGANISAGGSFDMWIAGASISDVQLDAPTYKSLVGIPGTAERSITVGSYVTKWNWTSIDGNNYKYNGTSRVNDYSTFSSMGPTGDNRQKPDVSAPGQAIVAALSTNASFAQPYIVTGGKHVVEQGTSMASPHVTGIVALMLQAKPTLTAAQIRSKISSTARKDAFTGNSWNAQWGNGKVDAQAAVQSALSVQQHESPVPSQYSLEQNYPNPFNPTTTIRFSLPTSGAVRMVVTNSLGQQITELVNDILDAGEYSVALDASSFSSGVYFYTLHSQSGTMTRKMLLIR